MGMWRAPSWPFTMCQCGVMDTAVPMPVLGAVADSSGAVAESAGLDGTWARYSICMCTHTRGGGDD